MSASSRLRRATRFSLGGLLFVTLCLCGYLGSHRAGERAGAQQRYDESYFVKTYSVADLVVEATTAETRSRIFAETTEWLKARVTPDRWGGDGDQTCEIQPFDTNGSLIVAQFGFGQDAVAAALAEYRKERTARQAAAAVAKMEALDPRVAGAPIVVLNYPYKNPLAYGATELSYANLVTALTEKWGAPEYSGSCTETGFPAWSVAQSLAVWSRDGGETYLAVQDQPDIGRAIVAGRHEE
jgi:hypothetical protein